MNIALLDKIEHLAGPQRAKTFRKAAEFILEHDCEFIVETGCYRGVRDDGQSTLILALLALELRGTLDCYDISADSINRALDLLAANGILNHPAINLLEGDSIALLGIIPDWRQIRFAYLDSYDHDPNNFMPCQRHQLAEVGAILGKMLPPCAILMDDNVPPHGGKVRLAVDFLRERGWATLCEDYQVLMYLL